MENKVVPFDYGGVPAKLSSYLQNAEKKLRTEYMSFTANCGQIFAEAQERLADYNNGGLFGAWIESIGFSRPTVYRMIDVYKFSLSQIETTKQAELFDSLPKTLQYDISAPSAPPQLVEAVMSGDITTHKEYIALKKELEEEKRSADEAVSRARSAEEKIKRLRERNDEQDDTIEELRTRITELESRPIEVAVAESGSVAEAERRFNQTIRKLNMDIAKITDECDKEVFEMRTERNHALDRAEAAEKALKKATAVQRYCVILTKFEYDALRKAAKGTAFESAVNNGRAM